MYSLLGRIETSAFSTWIRESDALYAFPGILVLHTLGMALAAGSVAAIGLRLLGVARQIPLASLRELLRVAWIGLSLNIFSGILLVLAYPTKALTNPIFYMKLLAIGATVAVVRHVDRRVLTVHDPGAVEPRKLVSVTLLVLTALTIVTGRLLPYTYRQMLVGY
ncbi:MAG: hypothetical protein WDO56_36050 [Gammaproteobacteria bacterium]